MQPQDRGSDKDGECGETKEDAEEVRRKRTGKHDADALEHGSDCEKKPQRRVDATDQERRQQAETGDCQQGQRRTALDAAHPSEGRATE